MAEAPSVIWLEVSHHRAFRCGGWAWVRRQGGEPVGAAGGDRNLTPERAALLGIVAALKDAPKGPVSIQTASPDVLATARILAGDGEPPNDDLDLWAPLLAAAVAGLRFVRPTAAPNTPTAFCAAWADLARDKAKAKGGFSAAIPKPNLAKIA